MNTVKEIMMAALQKGACDKSYGVSDWKTLVWLFFTPQGIEFCEKNNFPPIETFREMSNDIANYCVFVDTKNVKRSNDTNIALIGNTNAELVFYDNTRVHKVILMHGARAIIVARNYAVIRLINIRNCHVEINKDKTSVILK